MLILASDGGKDNIYDKLQDIKRKYVHGNEEIEAYFYKANENLETDYEIIGDTVYVKTEEKYPDLWKKFWLTLKVFEKRLNEFDFISRPNLSTFFIVDRYLHYLKNLPREKCCSGLIFYGGQPIPFPSGYLFTITPDIAKEFIYNDVIVDNEGIDDRCAGFILNKLNIPIKSVADFLEVNCTNLQFDSLAKSLEENENIFMIRIRNFTYSCENQFGVDCPGRLEDDFKIHSYLLKKYYNQDYFL